MKVEIITTLLKGKYRQLFGFDFSTLSSEGYLQRGVVEDTAQTLANIILWSDYYGLAETSEIFKEVLYTDGYLMHLILKDLYSSLFEVVL